MELKILSGNNFAESSSKAADDDMFGDILEKFGTAGKHKDDNKILTKEMGLEACTELYEKKNQVDGFDAMEATKKVFNKLWDQHDISNAGYIDISEGYGLLQDVASS